MAYPAEEHLFALKELLYEHPYKNKPEDTRIFGFSLVSHERLSYDMHLKSCSEVQALFMMTPYAYRTPKEARERLFKLDNFTCGADFYIDLYKRD